MKKLSFITLLFFFWACGVKKPEPTILKHQIDPIVHWDTCNLGTPEFTSFPKQSYDLIQKVKGTFKLKNSHFSFGDDYTCWCDSVSYCDGYTYCWVLTHPGKHFYHVWYRLDQYTNGECNWYGPASLSKKKFADALFKKGYSYKGQKVGIIGAFEFSDSLSMVQYSYGSEAAVSTDRVKFKISQYDTFNLKNIYHGQSFSPRQYDSITTSANNKE